MTGGVSYLTEKPKKIIKFVFFCQTTSLATPAQCVPVFNFLLCCDLMRFTARRKYGKGIIPSSSHFNFVAREKDWFRLPDRELKLNCDKKITERAKNTRCARIRGHVRTNFQQSTPFACPSSLACASVYFVSQVK